MALNLFIDTNVFLNFFHFSGEDLEELKKLTALIDAGDIVLWLPEQVCDEFHRNRDSKIKDAMGSTTQKFSMTAPAFFKNYAEFTDLMAAIREAGKKHASLMAVVKADMEANSLAADVTISAIFAKGKRIARSVEVFNKALIRYRVGNPPGKKKDTIGDEINWESLLHDVPENEDLHIVSVDGDYTSEILTGTPHSFLRTEYKVAKNADLHLHKNLQTFFAAHFPHIKLASDIAKAKAIDELAKSGSFYTTHLAIPALMAYVADFTSPEIEKLIAIAESNSQVGWIIGDPDVFAFYNSLAQSKEISAELQARILELLPADENDDEDLPF